MNRKVVLWGAPVLCVIFLVTIWYTGGWELSGTFILIAAAGTVFFTLFWGAFYLFLKKGKTKIPVWPVFLVVTLIIAGLIFFFVRNVRSVPSFYDEISHQDSLELQEFRYFRGETESWNFWVVVDENDSIIDARNVTKKPAIPEMRIFSEEILKEILKKGKNGK